MTKTEPVREMNYGTRDRFLPISHVSLDEWAVWDSKRDEIVAGPYTTEMQAVYVAAILTAKPSAVPFAPDPSVDR